jgi:hypothetical protein
MEVPIDQERARRAKQMENALANGRLEGLEPSEGAAAIFQRYVNGELTLEEMGRAIETYADREYGKIPLHLTA